MILLLLLQAVVSGVLALQGTASDPVVPGQPTSGLDYVQWAVDPEPGRKVLDGGDPSFIGPQMTVEPFTYLLDTRQMTNGPHLIFMHAFDRGKNHAMFTRALMVQNVGQRFFPLTPCRIVDTRDASFASPFGKPSIPAGGVRTYPILASSRCIVPSTALSYVFNVTIAPPTLGQLIDFITIWPTGQPRPFASVINDYLGTVENNMLILPAGTNGQIDVYASQNADLILDLYGYFAE